MSPQRDAPAITQPIEPVALPSAAVRLHEWIAREQDYEAFSSAHLAQVDAGTARELEAVLEAGACYVVVAALGGVGEVALSLQDEALHSVWTAPEHWDGAPSAAVCPRWTGPFRLRIEGLSGRVELAVQLARVRPSATRP